MVGLTGNRPYSCPECPWTFTRKATLKRHLDKVHHLAPIIPGPDRKTWIFNQLKHCAESLVRAESNGDKKEGQRYWDIMHSIWQHNKDIMTLEMLYEYKEEARKELKKLSG